MIICGVILLSYFTVGDEERDMKSEGITSADPQFEGSEVWYTLLAIFYMGLMTLSFSNGVLFIWFFEKKEVSASEFSIYSFLFAGLIGLIGIIIYSLIWSLNITLGEFAFLFFSGYVTMVGIYCMLVSVGYGVTAISFSISATSTIFAILINFFFFGQKIAFF